MNIRIFDNPKTFDRYSVVLEDGDCLGLSNNPGSPQGFSQWCGQVEAGPHLGKELSWEELPANVQAHIKIRLAGMEVSLPPRKVY